MISGQWKSVEKDNAIASIIDEENIAVEEITENILSTDSKLSREMNNKHYSCLLRIFSEAYRYMQPL